MTKTGLMLLVLFFASASACSGERRDDFESGEPRSGASAKAAAPAAPLAAAASATIATDAAAVEPPIAAEEEEPGEAEPAAAESDGDSDLTLVGIVRAGGKTPSALISYRGSQEIFRKGDPVFGKGTLTEVREESVVLLSDGEKTTLKLPTTPPEAPAPAAEVVAAPPPGAAAPAPVTESIARADAQAAMRDFSKVLEKANAEKVSIGGGHGVRLADVDPGSFLARMGLKSGDVLQRIEGVAVSDPDRLPDLSSAVGGPTLNVTFVRDGVGLTISRKLH